MLYRAILIILLLIAIVLTINERLQEQWSVNRAARLDQSPAGSSSRAAPVDGRSSSSFESGAYPAPQSSSLSVVTTPRIDPYPVNANAVVPTTKPLAIVPLAPFQQRSVRVLRAMDLLAAPERAAPTVEPPLHVEVGQTVRIVDDRSGWYQVDLATRRGWAPVDAFFEP